MPVAREAGDAAISTRADPALVKALARAFRYQKLLDEGRYASMSEMAAAEKISGDLYHSVTAAHLSYCRQSASTRAMYRQLCSWESAQRTATHAASII
jgi:hypothetical protein